MRWGRYLVIFAFVLGAVSAQAQDAAPAKRNAKHAVRKHTTPPRAAAKMATAKSEPAIPGPPSEALIEVGWTIVTDPATGIRIGLPTKLVPNARDADHGTRWSSAHGEVQVETFRIADRDLKLSALFEHEKRQPSTRQVEYSVLRDDIFFISGLQGLKKFSVKAQMRDGEVRGFTMLYDQMMETIVTPVMVAMSSAFSPFPERSAPFAALAKSVEYGNGLVVSAQGHIVTDRKLIEGCQVIIASGLGDAVRIADDKENGLAQSFSTGAHYRYAQIRRADADRHSRPEGAGRQPQDHRD
jgi:hypothetical protein